MREWFLTSWRQFIYHQSVNYPDEIHLEKVVNELSHLPPLVTSLEIKQLKQSIAYAGEGKAFILQGGDCAESFADCRSDIISNKLKIILQMSLILLHGIRKPIIRVGRIAGQYTKPRSSDYETFNGMTLPSYRGDLVNSVSFTREARTPNPDLLIKGYSCAAITLNFIRALLDGGFADLHHPQRWDLRFVEHSPEADAYYALVKSIAQSLDFLKTIEHLADNDGLNMPFYTSHEALHLHYEQALTRRLHDGLWYNLSTHLPWVGVRTATLDSAHIEFLRGVENPIGIKIGPTSSLDDVLTLLHLLNPRREAGRLLLITRFGIQHINNRLPSFIQAVQASKIPVTWSCDPMHGNTELTSDGVKTRHFDNILSELILALKIHQNHKSYLGGVHFELTGDNVTECIGGARGLIGSDLSKAYLSLVDPRLNYEQSLEMAICLSREMRKRYGP